MTLPASLRTNWRAPFPALVTGSGAITVTKVNGVWTIGFSVAGISVGVPPVSKYATDYVLVWDSIAQTFLNVSLQSLVTAFSTSYRYVAATPVTVLASDATIGIDTAAIAAPVTVNLPVALTRLNIALTIKDRTKKASAYPITITPNASDANGIDGNANLVMSTDGQSVTLLPINDTVGNGWIRTG